MGTLTSWLDVPELTNASGVGHYTTTFTWPPASGQADGAYLSLPPIDNALLLRINDKDVLLLDHARPIADMTQFLIEGENRVQIIVPTTMWNYIRTVASDIMSSAAPNVPYVMDKEMGIPMPGRVSNGLLGPVVVIPIISVVV
ncbi:uncharacterized protein FOBCDRAFT_321289 [Fusarium oxysporum Fo47]|uniref:Uncharacterized protein n=1 Tax=Fusarium oxysporum Fo47 TaxID=660027 RepID=W9J9D4_FUSOX|nr:uncharacterized protein FOBCDRAFT_321289 [Fusarium oxysporum Fo47]EWZ28471.1 hypothetical protein FOZG_17864 [Fusarium oxysporum Fo47]QKD56932.1 hypothetical protein FOBCDRAFT_321289 [Fusarium oxysporum Fo47]